MLGEGAFMLLRSGDWIAEMDVCEITMRRRRFPGKPLHLVTRVGACLARSLVDRSAAAHLESSTKKLSELWGPTAKPRLSVLWSVDALSGTAPPWRTTLWGKDDGRRPRMEEERRLVLAPR